VIYFTFCLLFTLSIANQADWLATVPDSTYLSQLTLPGTHDTMTFASTTTDGSNTQSVDLMTQFLMGIRYIDIRCVRYSQKCYLYHGIEYLRLEWDNDVEPVLISFLTAHPTEFIVMRLKEEDTSNDLETWLKFVQRTTSRNFNLWVRGRGPNPSVFWMRGQVYVLRDFWSPETYTYNSISPDPVYYPGTHYDFSSGNLRLQDQWKNIVADQLINKWGYVINHFYSAISDPKPVSCCSPNLYINHGSAGYSGLMPYSIAGYINPRIEKWLNRRAFWDRLGIIVYDFPSQSLVDVTIKINFLPKTSYNYISNTETLKYIGINGGADDDGQPIDQASLSEWNGTGQMDIFAQWYWYPAGSNRYCNHATAKCIETNNGDMSNGATLQQWTYSSNNYLQWDLIFYSNPDMYKICSKVDSSKCWEIENGNMQSFYRGARAQIWTTTLPRSVWKLEGVSTSDYIFPSVEDEAVGSVFEHPLSHPVIIGLSVVGTLVGVVFVFAVVVLVRRRIKNQQPSTDEVGYVKYSS